MVARATFAQNDSKEYYTPKSLILPLHDEKNQLHMSLGRGGGFDLNLSYTFTDKLAVFTTASYDIGSKTRVTILGSQYKIEKNDYCIKGGLGYFTKVDNKILEVYLGGGSTKIDNYWYFRGYPEGGEATQARYNTLFVQCNSGTKRLQSDFAVGIRISYSVYTDFRFSSTDPNAKYIKSRYENLKGISADPVISYSYKLKRIKLNAQAGFAFPLTKNSATRVTEHTTNYGTTIVTSQDNIALSAILGRLSAQYNLSLKKR